MIIPIKCITCGTVIADKYQYFCEEVRRRKLTGKAKDDVGQLRAITYLTTGNQAKTAEGHVLDEMGLSLCCRRHLLTHVDING